MIIEQYDIRLAARPRGFHLITRELEDHLDRLGAIEVGVAHLFLQHTSASLTINENASSDVPRDFERYFNQAVPENAPYWEHTIEGPDDMPAHIKTSMMGSNLSIPITNGGFALGTWQGIYLCEHRNRGGARRLVATIMGREAR